MEKKKSPYRQWPKLQELWSHKASSSCLWDFNSRMELPSFCDGNLFLRDSCNSTQIASQWCNRVLCRCMTGIRNCTRHPVAQCIPLLTCWWCKKGKKELIYNWSLGPASDCQNPEKVTVWDWARSLTSHSTINNYLCFWAFSNLQDGQANNYHGYLPILPSQKNKEYFQYHYWIFKKIPKNLIKYN